MLEIIAMTTFKERWFNTWFVVIWSQNVHFVHPEQVF